MRRSHTLIQSKSNRQGLALFIILMMMVAIALLVVAAMQSYNIEQRVSTNDADRKLAFPLTESALRERESAILSLSDSVTLNDNCGNGLCRAAGTAERTDSIEIAGTSNIEAWLRKCGDRPRIDGKGKKYPENTKVSLPNGVGRNPRYVIEYVSNSSTGANIYRMTAKAQGKNDNTTVMIRSYVSSEQEDTVVKTSRFYDFTLVKMLITVAIIGILATVAMPFYNRYIERGYLSQVYTDLVSIDNNVRTYIVKSPGIKIDSDKLKNIISKSVTAEIAERHDSAGSVPDDKSRRYLLSATSRADMGYTQALQTDSLDEAYKCTGAASAKVFSTSQADDEGYKRIGKTEI